MLEIGLGSFPSSSIGTNDNIYLSFSLFGSHSIFYVSVSSGGGCLVFYHRFLFTGTQAHNNRPACSMPCVDTQRRKF